MKLTPFAKYSWFVVVCVVIVILWGAVVRATGSGAGCGSHWPLCNGEVIPPTETMETFIEFTHRLTTGFLGIFMLGLLGWAFRRYKKGHPVRKAAVWSMVFILTESLVGAGLVKFEWVADNDSMARVYTMAFHLLNTFILLGAVTLAAWFAGEGKSFRIRNQGTLGWLLIGATVSLLILGMSGAIIALGDTLFMQAGITPEESPVVAMLIDLRIYHPMIAFLVLIPLAMAAYHVYDGEFDSFSRRMALAVGGTYLAQLAIGGLNVYLHAPVWMQIVHLLMSNIIWILLVLMAASALSQKEARGLTSEERPAQTQATLQSPVS